MQVLKSYRVAGLSRQATPVEADEINQACLGCGVMPLTGDLAWTIRASCRHALPQPPLHWTRSTHRLTECHKLAGPDLRSHAHSASLLDCVCSRLATRRILRVNSVYQSLVKRVSRDNVGPNVKQGSRIFIAVFSQ
ncbi:hypothetical protein RRG08_057906 [Elysia crispata]|uniref:Uncharacterized protein n=1 Tax=Elysia crispata TaxID=231223 RepID=A0AAE0ZQR2_9GAST|nr:hypothetical protein RRG08_057906 [Elysia crispata]